MTESRKRDRDIAEIDQDNFQNTPRTSDNDIDQESATTVANNNLQDIIKRLITSDNRIGWPADHFMKNLEKLKHGWFRPGNQEMLERILRFEQYLSSTTTPSNSHSGTNDGSSSSNSSIITRKDGQDLKKISCILELGSWLGNSTEFLLRNSNINNSHVGSSNNNNNEVVVFAVDLWENEYFYSDNHYDKNDLKFSQILEKNSIYYQFLKNLLDYKYFQIPSPFLTSATVGGPSSIEETHADQLHYRLVPMKMDSCTALETLHQNHILPDLIYIDASHHYDYVLKDIATCVNLFPNAILVGDDWDNKEVKQAVIDMAQKFGKDIYIRKNTCWTYSKQLMAGIDAVEANEQAVEQQQKKRLKSIQKGSFADALKLIKEGRGKANL